MRRRILALAALALALGSPASAQYFGRNKVAWERHHFRTLQTEHFDVLHYPEAGEPVGDAARMAERWYGRLSPLLGEAFAERVPIVLYADHPDFQQTRTTPGPVGEGTGGFTEPMLDRVVLPLTGVARDTDHVLGHELVHAFQFRTAESESRTGRFSLGAMPLFLIEGMAEYLSVGREDPHTAMWLRDAVQGNVVPSWKELNTDPRIFPYRYGQALWAYIAGRWGDETVPELYREAGFRGTENAIASVLGLPAESLLSDWAGEVRRTYLPLMEGRTPPGSLGTALVPTRRESPLQIAPVLSPDGRRLAFLGAEEPFSIDLYVADTATGRARKLASTRSDPHFDALRFIDSAGAWSPDGSRLAFVVFARGDNEIAVLDAERRKVIRRYHPEHIGAITNLAWSPDGRLLAFSGQAGGVSDLYLLELETGAVERLTSDPYADLQPAWSPDGRTLAFATDRGPETDFAALVYGPIRLALIDVQTRDVRLFPVVTRGKQINPQYAPDGKSLLFVSDADGFSDVYRVSLATGEVRRLTRCATGISGITPLAPAISVSPGSRRVAVTVFRNGGHELRAIPLEEGEPAAPGPPDAAAPRAALLPPVAPEIPSPVAAYLAAPRPAAAPVARPVTGYRPRLRLAYVGPPAVGVTAGISGTSVGGAAAFGFSDTLGNHIVGVGIEAQGEFQDFGGQVVYRNQARRFNWGLGVSREPYVSLGTAVSTQTVVLDGQPAEALVVDRITQRTHLDSGSAVLQFPLSTRRRVELIGGTTRYGFDVEVEREYIVEGRVVGRERPAPEAPEDFQLNEAGLALVNDAASFGFTAPVAGSRWRLEVGRTSGDVEFDSLLVDARRYFLRSPWTLAVRALHYGRYGDDAENGRLNPLYLGRFQFVRGYDSFDASECAPAPEDPEGCPQLERLLGSRIAVVSAELRVPLFGVPEYGLIAGRFLPTDLAAFVDVGAAWTSDQRPRWTWDPDALDRVPVASAGVAARMLLGPVVLQLTYARPFHRPGENGEFTLELVPGW